MYNDILKQLNITSHQIRVFLGTMIAMFVMMVFHYLGVHSVFKSLDFTMPVQKKADAMDIISPKLKQKNNDFKLKKETMIMNQAYAENIPQTYDSAAGYALVDLDTGKVLAEKNGDKQIAIASITKIMTAVVALDLARPDEVFTVTEQAAAMPPTKLVLTPGEKMTLEELLNASLMTSANDATEEIRDGVNEKYGDEIFIKAMNEKAAILGMKHSHFTTPQGFDYANNSSSPEDLAVLSAYALKNYPLIAEIVKKDYQFLPASGNHKQLDLYNWNGLIGVYPDTVGMKIGNTTAAGYTTTVVSNRGGKKLFAVLLGAPGVLERDMWTAQLLDRGYKETLALEPSNVTEEQLQAKYATWKYGE
jgi:D-alanyl-D-alanine carboxypeptidase